MSVALGNLGGHNANCAVVMNVVHFSNTTSLSKATSLILDTPEQTT